jgi:3-phenylpropionate/cinnamic acid dioxygenase small subunit
MSDARGEIENLLYLYGERIDRGDFAGVASLFEKAEITVEGRSARTRGRDAVQKLYESTTRRYEDGTPLTKHITTNPIIEVNEAVNEATCRSYFTVLQQTPTLPLQIIITGRYHDAFACDDGAWHFASRHMFLDQIGDLTQHLLLNAKDLEST